MSKWKKWLGSVTDSGDDNVHNSYYNVDYCDSVDENGNSKMILLEPRAYSESQQIVDYLKNRHTVVVNLKRVTSDQAKRIVDFLSGAIYAIGGGLQKIGGGIFLCTPNNVNIEGKITDEKEGKDIHNNDDIDTDW
jgi:cell division inhibitor SepF